MSTDASATELEADTPPGPIAPVSRPKTAARDWYDALSEWYDVVADPFEAPARERGLALLEPEPGERIVDVGCGTGTALVSIARAVGTEGTAVGVDLAPGMCRRSRQALENAGLERGLVVTGDGAALPFPEDAFDALFASYVLELFDTDELLAVLEEWRRVLAPDGRLCIVSLSRRDAGPVTGLYERVHGLVPTYVDCRPIYLRETLLEADFRVVESETARAWQLPVEVVRARPEP